MAAVTCLSCGKIYGAHFAKCIHCNAPNATAPPPPPPSAPAPAPGLAAKAATPRPASVAPAKPICPLCSGTPGPGRIRVETREFKETTWTLKKRYLVRWVDVPGVCAGCMKGLAIKRYVADVLIPLPFIIIFFLLVATNNKLFLGLFLVYFFVLFKWSWGLGYVWADALLYGNQLDMALGPYVPPGDPGTTRFPAGLWHCLVRLAGLPALGVVLVLLLGAVLKHAAPAKAGASAEAAASADPETFLRTARDISVPVDPQTLAMKKMGVKRTDVSFYAVYVTPAHPPPGTDYLLMSGPQLVSSFLQTAGTDNDLLFFRGGGPSSLKRRDVEAIAPKLPKPDPLPTNVLRGP
jgi:hypothetical protein